MISKEERDKKLKKRIYELLPLSLTIYGFAGTIYFIFYFKSDFDIFSNTLLIASISLAVIGLFTMMSKYLRQSKEKDTITSNDDILNEIRKQLDYSSYRNKEQFERFDKFEHSVSDVISKLEGQVTQNAKHELDETQKKALFEKISSSIESNLTKDFYDKIGESIKFNVAEEKREQVYTLAKRFETSIGRLNREIGLLTKRANINLMIGSIITITALVLLGYFVVTENFNSDDIFKVSLHFLPRLSLVIFIEFFSFFFLKLYRTSLSEIKYYQNELTNIESQQMAIFTATNFGNSSDLSIVINDLSKVERNFKLQKGESTVELEKNKIEMTNLKDTLKTVLNSIPKGK